MAILEIKNIKRILIVQYKPFGDVLLNTACFGDIRRRFPEAEIHFLVSSPYDHILNNNPYIDKVIVFDRHRNWRQNVERFRVMVQLWRNNYDLVIDQLKNFTSALVVLFSGAPYRVCHSNNRFRRLYNIHGPVTGIRYSALMKYDILTVMGVEIKKPELYYYVTPDANEFAHKWFVDHGLTKEKTIVISPGSPVARKRWHPDAYVQLADMILSKTDLKVVFLWAPDELEMCQAIARKMEQQPLLAPRTNFNEGAAFLQQAQLLISNDGGIYHLAVAVKTPSLAIFGETQSKKWSAQGVFPGHYHIVNAAWNDRTDRTFGVSAEQVFERVLSILKELNS